MSEETTTTMEAEAVSDTDAVEENEAPSSFVDAALKAMEEGEPKEDPKPEPEPEPEPEAAAEEPEKKSRSASDFKLIKQRAKEAAGEVEKLKAEIEELKKVEPAGDPEIDRLRQERNELSARLKAASLERHPEFSQHYKDKIGSILERAKGIAGAEYADRIEALMNMPDSEYKTSALDDIFSDLSTSKQAQLGALIAQMDEVSGERSSQLQNADQTYEQLMSKQQEKQNQWIKDNETVFGKVGETAKDWFVFQEREGEAEWNNAVRDRVSVAKNIYLGESTPEQLATAAYMASSADFLYDTLTKELEAHALTKQQLKEMQGATPSIDSDGQKKDTSDMSFIDTVNAAMKG
jgi:hypothetical protein